MNRGVQKPGGRPRVYSEEQRAEAIRRLDMGESLNQVSRALSIPRTTLQTWHGEMRLADPAYTESLALKVRAELERIAFGNLSDVMSWDSDANSVQLVPSEALTPSQAALIESVQIKRERKVRGAGDSAEEWETSDIRIKTRDKLAALRALAQYSGLIESGPRVQIDARQQTVNAYRELSTEELRRLAAPEEPQTYDTQFANLPAKQQIPRGQTNNPHDATG